LVKKKLGDLEKNMDIETRVLMGITAKHISPGNQLMGDEAFETAWA
jgi:hypothetical protein